MITEDKKKELNQAIKTLIRSENRRLFHNDDGTFVVTVPMTEAIDVVNKLIKELEQKEG